MADQTPTGINVGTLGTISSGLGSYNGRVSTGSRTSSFSRSNQMESLSLSDFVDTDVVDYENAEAPSTDEILAMGKGPLNPELFTPDGRERMKRQIEERKLQQQKRAESIKAIMSCGYTETDAIRIIDGEITPQALYDEIFQEYLTAEDPTQTRFYAILKQMVYTDGYYFDRGKLTQQREELQTELDELRNPDDENITYIENNITTYEDVINNAIYDFDTDTYTYTRSDGVEITLTQEQMDSLKGTLAFWEKTLYDYKTAKSTRITELETEIATIDEKLSDTTREDFPYASEEEVDARISEIDTKIAELIELKAAKEKAITDKMYGREISDDDFRNPEYILNYLESANITAWLGVDKEGVDTKGWTIIKINPDEYVLMDGQRNYIDLNGNPGKSSFTASELIAAGFTLTPSHPFDPSRVSEEEKAEPAAIDAEIEALKTEKQKLLDKKEVIEAEFKWFLKNARYVMQPDFAEYSEPNDSDITGNTTVMALRYRPQGKDKMYISDIVGIEGLELDTIKGSILAGMINNKCIMYTLDGELVDRKGYTLYIGDEGFELIVENFADYCSKGVFTETEIKIFNYICNKEGYAAGYEYLMSLYNELDGRYLALRRKEDTEHARASVFSGLESMFRAPYDAIVNMQKQRKRKASGQNLLLSDAYSTASTIRSTLSGDIRRLYGDTMGDIFDVSYSMEQSLINTMIVVASGGNPAVAVLSTTLIMGTPVYNDTLYAALEKGVPDDQAILYAASCAVIEIAMESFSTIHLAGIAGGFEKALSSGAVSSTIEKLVSFMEPEKREFASRMLLTAYCALTQGLIEANEEYDTEILSALAEQLIEGDLSASYQKFEEYKMLHPGCSDAEAMIAVLNELHSDGLRAAWYGFVSGSILGGASSGGSNVVITDISNGNESIYYEGVHDGSIDVSNNSVTDITTDTGLETGQEVQTNTETGTLTEIPASPLESIDPKALTTEYKSRADMKNMTALEKEQYLNKITDGRFTAALDSWQQAVFEANLNAEIKAANKRTIYEIAKNMGFDVKNANKYLTDNGTKVNYYQLAVDIANATGMDANTVYQDIVQYLIDFPITIDTETLYRTSIEECMAVEDILIQRYENGDIIDIDKALEMVAVDKRALQLKTYLYEDQVTTADIKRSKYYQEYVTEVISEERYQELEHEMVPNGVEGKVYCVQQTWAFDQFALGAGNLGRTEGYYVISQKQLQAALSKATGQEITAADVEKIMSGNTTGYTIDKKVLAKELGFKENYFNDGFTIVESTATPESLRASLPTDAGANAQYVPGMQTSGNSNEMINAQVTGMDLQETTPGSGVYTDASGQGVSAVTFK